MAHTSSPLSPDRWILDMFSSRAARSGAVIRRKACHIERYAGMDRFLHECARRGFQVIANEDHIIVVCNQSPLRRLRAPFSFKENGPETLKVSDHRSV